MRKLKGIILEDAIFDLEEIWLYTIDTWSVEQADRYHSLIMREIQFLATKPKSGKILEHIRKGYLSAKVKSHYLFYRFNSKEIEIVRILHESMDIPNRLED